MFGCMEPFRFEHEKISQRFKIIQQLPSFNHELKYGSIFNSYVFGFDEDNTKPQPQDPRSSFTAPTSKIDLTQDLLGI